MKVLNETINHQLAHRTIREFKDEKIPDEILETLIEVGFVIKNMWLVRQS
jgi:hypothetical protein